MNNPSVEKPSTGSPSDDTRLRGRDITIDYLRSFVIVLVVFLQAALAYTSFTTYDEARWIDSSAPVMDASRILDNLSANAYSIYLIHYAFVLWIQFALLSAPWPAWLKFSVTFVEGLALSWGTSILVRRIPAVRRVL